MFPWDVVRRATLVSTAMVVLVIGRSGQAIRDGCESHNKIVI